MTISGFIAYIKQAWKNKPDTSTPLSADRLAHIENGIDGNSDAIESIAAAVVSQIVNDPNKIASMAALYAVNQGLTTCNANYEKLINDLPSYETAGEYPQKIRIPAKTFNLLIYGGITSLTRQDDSRYEGTVSFSTPFSDTGAYMVVATSKWNERFFTISTSKFESYVAFEAYGGSNAFSETDTVDIDYIIIGRENRS